MKKAFTNADTNNNGRLQETAFRQFVADGFGPNWNSDKKYDLLCSNYRADLGSVGITWKTALKIWQKFNQPPKSEDFGLGDSCSQSNINIDDFSNMKPWQKRMRLKFLERYALASKGSNCKENCKNDDDRGIVVDELEEKLQSFVTNVRQERKQRKKEEEISVRLYNENNNLKNVVEELEIRCNKLEMQLKQAQEVNNYDIKKMVHEKLKWIGIDGNRDIKLKSNLNGDINYNTNEAASRPRSIVDGCQLISDENDDTKCNRNHNHDHDQETNHDIYKLSKYKLGLDLIELGTNIIDNMKMDTCSKYKRNFTCVETKDKLNPTNASIHLRDDRFTLDSLVNDLQASKSNVLTYNYKSVGVNDSAATTISDNKNYKTGTNAEIIDTFEKS